MSRLWYILIQNRLTYFNSYACKNNHASCLLNVEHTLWLVDMKQNVFYIHTYLSHYLSLKCFNSLLYAFQGLYHIVDTDTTQMFVFWRSFILQIFCFFCRQILKWFIRSTRWWHVASWTYQTLIVCHHSWYVSHNYNHSSGPSRTVSRVCVYVCLWIITWIRQSFI